jgi:hypothetical protein
MRPVLFGLSVTHELQQLETATVTDIVVPAGTLAVFATSATSVSLTMTV